MKKLTANVAKRITNKTNRTRPKTFQDVVDFLATEAKNGHSNTFIDGDLKTLETIKTELAERGFRVYIEEYTGTPFLSVEW